MMKKESAEFARKPQRSKYMNFNIVVEIYNTCVRGE